MNELGRLETDDLIPAGNADSCHSSADEPMAASIRRRLFRAPHQSDWCSALGPQPASMPRLGVSATMCPSLPAPWQRRPCSCLFVAISVPRGPIRPGRGGYSHRRTTARWFCGRAPNGHSAHAQRTPAVLRARPAAGLYAAPGSIGHDVPVAPRTVAAAAMLVPVRGYFCPPRTNSARTWRLLPPANHRALVLRPRAQRTLGAQRTRRTADSVAALRRRLLRCRLPRGV